MLPNTILPDWYMSIIFFIVLKCKRQFCIVNRDYLVWTSLSLSGVCLWSFVHSHGTPVDLEGRNGCSSYGVHTRMFDCGSGCIEMLSLCPEQVSKVLLLSLFTSRMLSETQPGRGADPDTLLHVLADEGLWERERCCCGTFDERHCRGLVWRHLCGSLWLQNLDIWQVAWG